MMLATDIALKADPVYGPIAKHFHQNQDQLAELFR
jgi:catalase-peroxidase